MGSSPDAVRPVADPSSREPGELSQPGAAFTPPAVPALMPHPLPLPGTHRRRQGATGEPALVQMVQPEQACLNTFYIRPLRRRALHPEVQPDWPGRTTGWSECVILCTL